MLAIIRFEFNKIASKRNIILLIILPVILNLIYLVNNYVHSSQEAINYTKGRNLVYDQVEGTVTNEKYNFINNTFVELSSTTEDGRADIEVSADSTTYTGYTFGDYMLFSQLHMEYIDSIEYKTKIINKVNDLKKAKNLFEDDQEKNRINKMIDSYQNREINIFYDYQGIDALFYNNFSTFLCILIVIFIITQVVCNEYETGNYKIVYSTEIGRTKIMKAKIITVISFILTIYCILSFEDFLFFKFNNGFNGWLSPFFAMNKSSMSFFTASILSAYLYELIIRLLGLVLISIFIMVAAVLIKRSYILIVSVILFLFVLFSNFHLSVWNPITYLEPIKVLNDLNFMYIFNYPVLKYHYIIIFISITLFVSLILYFIISKNNNRKRGKLLWK